MRHRHQGEGEVSAAPAFSGRCKEDEFEIELVVSFASLSLEDRRSDTMKDKDEQTALIGMAIGAAVISLVATQKQINQGSIVDELVRLGRQKGDGWKMRFLFRPPAWSEKAPSQPRPCLAIHLPVSSQFSFPGSRPGERRLLLSESVTDWRFLILTTGPAPSRPCWPLGDTVTFPSPGCAINRNRVICYCINRYFRYIFTIACEYRTISE